MRADEFLAQLEADPEYQKKKREREEHMALVAARLAQDEAGLVAEIRAVGYKIEGVYDFVNTCAEYPEAIPILIRHLDVPHEARIREGIIRSLTIKYGGIALEEALLKHFRQESDSLLRWLLANALIAAMPLARLKTIPEIEETLRGRSRG